MNLLSHLPSDLREALYNRWDPETGLEADAIRTLLTRIGIPLDQIARESGCDRHYVHHVCTRIRRNALVESRISHHLSVLGLIPEIIWGPQGPKRPSVRALPAEFTGVPPFSGRFLPQKHGLALLVDCETTGSSPRKHAAIEVAMLQVVYHRDPRNGPGLLGGIGGYVGLRDPGEAPVDHFAMRIHGIKLASLFGRKFDLKRTGKLVSGSDLVIAHNASFDRSFLAPLIPGLAAKPWACSYRDIPWKDLGFGSCGLGNLSEAMSIPRPAHRAASDVIALYHALSTPLPDGRSGFQHLMAALGRE